MNESNAKNQTETEEEEAPPRRPRGFALLTPERRREIAQAGGRAAQRSERARRWSVEEARRQAPRGGAASGAGARNKLRAAERRTAT